MFELSTVLPAVFVRQEFATILFSVFVVLYAILRPPMIRDDEDRPLPPIKVVRLAVIVLYLSVYLALTGLAVMGGKSFSALAAQYLEQTAYSFSRYVNAPDIKSSAPALAFTLLFFSMFFEPIRQLERQILVWLHLGSHLGNDGKLLARHLATCAYEPSEKQRQRSIDRLSGFHLFLSDRKTDTIRLRSVDSWRKADALLSLIGEWNADGRSTLSKEHRRRIKTLAAAHDRKTRLAVGVVGLIARAGDKAAALSRISRAMDATQGAGAIPEDSETKLASIIGAEELQRLERHETDVRPGDVRQDEAIIVNSQELATYLEPIDDYFVEEYALILDELGDIAAHALLQAGDEAGARLETLKEAGFRGLGLIERMDIPRLLLILFGVAVAGFAILITLGPMQNTDAEIRRQMQNDRAVMIGAIALIMAVATLVGAYIGSTGSLARAQPFPWRGYLQAGFAGVLAFFLIHAVQFQLFGDPLAKRRELEAKRQELVIAVQSPLLQPEVRRQSAEVAAERRKPVEVNRPLLRIAPFSILPFAIVIGLCVLARFERPWIPAAARGSRLATKVFERTVDGLAMAIIVMLAVLAAFGLATALGTMPPRPEAGPTAAGLPRVVLILIPFSMLGFTIGALVLRDMRLAAHTRLVQADPAPQPPARPTAIEHDPMKAAGVNAAGATLG